MSRPNEVPGPVGEQSRCPKLACPCGGEAGVRHFATLSDALSKLGVAVEFLDAYARATHEPHSAIVKAADLLDAARVMLAREVAP